MTEFDSLKLSTISATNVYTLLTGLIVPRPIALVSTVSESGVQNLAPFSFFMLGGANPASLMIAPGVNSKGSDKDTLRNIRMNGEFVVNLVHREMIDGMNQASTALLPEESEWDLTNFEALESVHVQAHRVSQSFVQLECRLFQIVEHGSGAGAARYVIGEILEVHAAKRATGFNPIARLGGAEYLDLETMTRFEMTRPNS